jgi:hypothetical protein
LKRLSSAKKNVSLEGVTEETIADALKQLLEKGENTSGPIFLDMGPKVIECCTFLVRCCQRLVQHSASHSRQHKGASPVVKIYKSALTTFFTKRLVSSRSASAADRLPVCYRNCHVVITSLHVQIYSRVA